MNLCRRCCRPCRSIRSRENPCITDFTSANPWYIASAQIAKTTMAAPPVERNGSTKPMARPQCGASPPPKPPTEIGCCTRCSRNRRKRATDSIIPLCQPSSAKPPSRIPGSTLAWHASHSHNPGTAHVAFAASAGDFGGARKESIVVEDR